MEVSHEADHHPGWFGRTASAGTSLERQQERVDPFSVDLSRKHQEGGAPSQDAVAPLRTKGSDTMFVFVPSIVLAE